MQKKKERKRKNRNRGFVRVSSCRFSRTLYSNQSKHDDDEDGRCVAEKVLSKQHQTRYTIFPLSRRKYNASRRFLASRSHHHQRSTKSSQARKEDEASNIASSVATVGYVAPACGPTTKRERHLINNPPDREYTREVASYRKMPRVQAVRQGGAQQASDRPDWHRHARLRRRQRQQRQATTRGERRRISAAPATRIRRSRRRLRNARAVGTARQQKRKRNPVVVVVVRFRLLL